MKNKTLIISAVVIFAFVLVIVGFIGYNAVLADENTTYPPIIQKLVERFGLDPTEVQKVFTETRTEMGLQREQSFQQRFEERLQNAVENGKITEAQKSAIIAKQAEMKEKIGELKDLSSQDKKEAMNNIREEMSAWAKDNGIEDGWCMGLDIPGLGGLGNFGRGHGMRQGMGAGFGLRPGQNFEE